MLLLLLLLMVVVLLCRCGGLCAAAGGRLDDIDLGQHALCAQEEFDCAHVSAWRGLAKSRLGPGQARGRADGIGAAGRCKFGVSAAARAVGIRSLPVRLVGYTWG